MCAVKSTVSGIEMGLVFLTTFTTIMGSPVFLSTLTLPYFSFFPLKLVEQDRFEYEGTQVQL